MTKIYVTPGLLKDRRTTGLDRFSLEIKAGEFVGILGLNGSGKTTSMKLGLGLLKPTRGKVRLFGQDPASRDALNLVGYLPELPYFYSQLTPVEALEFYGRLSGLDEAGLPDRAKKTLERVGLAKRASQRVGEFSKGLRQRLGLAQALLHEPKLLILDEPVSGLDPIAIKEMRDLLHSLHDEGKSLFLSSHSISEVENLCDRVAILQDGRLVRTVLRSEWKSQPGKLESILIEAVTPE